MYEYRALLVRVIDGDTLVVDIDLGLHTWRKGEVIRLAGVDCPERNTEAGRAATVFTQGQVGPAGSELVIITHKDRTEKYGRWLAEVWTSGHASGVEHPLGRLLVEAGHARPWPR